MKISPIVIDTGPLLTYLAIRYLDSVDAPKARRDQIFREMRTKDFGETEQRRFLELMKRRVYTTAPVVAEALKLRGNSALRSDKERFLRSSVELLAGDTISELACPIAEIFARDDFREMVCQYGLTDAGLIFVAAKIDALVLTDDGAYSRAIREALVT